MRDAIQVAQRAMVMGAVALRASMEITVHPRAAEVSVRILPWLEDLGVAEEIDPLERDILLTPHGQLEREQSADANWSGEGGALFCWALDMGPQPPLLQLADQKNVIDGLRIMHPDAREHLQAPALRSTQQLQQFCKTTLLTRLGLQELRSGPSAEIQRKFARQKLSAFGIEVTDSDFDEIRRLVDAAPMEQRRSAVGAYVARDVAATWLLGSRERYFGDD